MKLHSYMAVALKHTHPCTGFWDAVAKNRLPTVSNTTIQISASSISSGPLLRLLARREVFSGVREVRGLQSLGAEGPHLHHPAAEAQEQHGEPGTSHAN